MAISTAEWVVMALLTVLTVGGLYLVYIKGYRRRETEHVHQLKTKASTLREFENEIREMYNPRERKELTNLTLNSGTLQNEDVSDEEVARVLSTPRSVQQENLYGIGWYKILHRTRSRQGQSLQSEAISVIHPGDLVYIEATALWKNRIRGKLGKNAAGWLTMEDVDRKKVFVEKTKTPSQYETGSNKEESEEHVENIISPLKISKIDSDSEEKQRESDSEQQAPVSKSKPATPVDTEYEHIMEVEIPEIPTKKKKKRKPRTIEIEDGLHPQRHVKESHRWKQKADRRRREKEKYKNIHTEEFGVSYDPVNREKLEEEIYLALRKRRKDRERRKKQSRSSHLFTHHVVTHHLMPDWDGHEEPHHLDVVDEVLFDGGGILDEILDEYGAKWEAGRIRQESREEGETHKTRSSRRKKRDPRQRRHAPRHRADTAPTRAKHHHSRHRAGTDYVRHRDQHHHAEYYANHGDQQYTANYYYPMYDMQQQQHWGADQAVWEAHFGHNGDRRYGEYILE